MARPFRLGVYAMLTPYLTGALVLVALPVALAGVLAFTAYDGLSAPRWRGLGNFHDLLDDPLFAIAAWNSLAFVLLTVPLRLAITLGLALLLRRPRPGVGLYRVAVYPPTVVPSPAYALVWLWILNPLYGPLNLVLAGLGLPTPAWLADSATALPALFQIRRGLRRPAGGPPGDPGRVLRRLRARRGGPRRAAPAPDAAAAGALAVARHDPRRHHERPEHLHPRAADDGRPQATQRNFANTYG